MGKLVGVVGRYGPLVAAILVGFGGLLSQVVPNAKPVVDSIVTLLGFLGASADTEVVAAITGVVASALLAYGGTRKTINIVKDKLAPKE
jgi:hypothetical protein